MSLLKYAYRQSEKGFGKTILFSLLLGLFYALSILVVLIRWYNGIDKPAIHAFIDESGCKIVEYELTCNDNKYEYEKFVIDLEFDENANEYKSDTIILTKEYIITQGVKTSYKEIMKSINPEKQNLFVDDFIKILDTLATTLYTFGFAFSFIGGTLFYLLANTLMAFVIRSIINSSMKKNFKYEQIYKLTILTSLPYILFNAICRMIFGGPIVGSPITSLIGSFIPFFGTMLAIVLDYAIVYGLTYLVIKNGYEEPKTLVDDNQNYVEAEFKEINE